MAQAQDCYESTFSISLEDAFAFTGVELHSSSEITVTYELQTGNPAAVDITTNSWQDAESLITAEASNAVFVMTTVSAAESEDPEDPEDPEPEVHILSCYYITTYGMSLLVYVVQSSIEFACLSV